MRTSMPRRAGSATASARGAIARSYRSTSSARKRSSSGLSPRGCGSILAGVKEALQCLRPHDVHDLDRLLARRGDEVQHIGRGVEVEDVERIGRLQLAERPAAVAGLLVVDGLVEPEASGAGEGEQAVAEAGLAG